MADSVFTVTDVRAPRRVTSDRIARIAGDIASAAAADTPVGRGRRAGTLRRSWNVERGRSPGTAFVYNNARNQSGKLYAHLVEYGNRGRPPRAMLGRAVARYRQ